MVRYRQEILHSFLTKEKRLLLAIELSEFDRGVRRERLRHQHPDWSELEVKHEIIRQAFLPDPTPDWLEKRLQEDLEKAARIGQMTWLATLSVVAKIYF